MSTVSSAPVARKLAGECLGPQQHVTLPAPLDDRLIAAVRKLGVARSLLLREAVRLGLKTASAYLRREQRQEQRPARTGGSR